MMRIFIRKRTNKFRNILAFFGKCKKQLLISHQLMSHYVSWPNQVLF